MRWLILILVVANLGVFFWFTLSEPGNVRSVDEGRLPRVAEIELIGEQQGASPASRELRSQPEPQPEPESGERVDGSGLEIATDSSPGTEEVETSPEDPVSPSSEPPAEAEPERQCFGIGWFREQESAAAYRQGLQARRADLLLRGMTEQSEPLEPFHWVMIPPMENRQVALDRYRELVDQGIEAYVVPSGERENAISLGLFRSLRSAERVLERRQQQNINAILVKFPRNRISYALVFEGVPPASFDELGGVSRQSEAGLQLIEFSDCEGVATAEKNP